MTQRDCTVCGAAFQSNQPRQRVCSKRCRNRRPKGTWRERMAKRALSAPQRPCRYCGSDFAVIPKNSTTFCSYRCRGLYTAATRPGATCTVATRQDITPSPTKARRNYRLRVGRVALVDRQSIYRRDQWRCRLCGKPVNRSIGVPHPYAATLDHILPLALGGTHEPSNVQLAHFICNSRKGDRGQLPLPLVA